MLDYRDIAAHRGDFPGLNMLGRLLEFVRKEINEGRIIYFGPTNGSAEKDRAFSSALLEEEGREFDIPSLMAYQPRNFRPILKCYLCGRIGHIRRFCYQRPASVAFNGQRRAPNLDLDAGYGKFDRSRIFVSSQYDYRKRNSSVRPQDRPGV